MNLPKITSDTGIVEVEGLSPMKTADRVGIMAPHSPASGMQSIISNVSAHVVWPSQDAAVIMA